MPAIDATGRETISEMAIVDTFTKLIFGEDGYSDRELLIIENFRAVDASVARDSLEEMGEYLRNLGVREMIHLVTRLREHMEEEQAGANGVTRDRDRSSQPQPQPRPRNPRPR